MLYFGKISASHLKIMRMKVVITLSSTNSKKYSINGLAYLHLHVNLKIKQKVLHTLWRNKITSHDFI
jgi:hypothetical protein